MGARPRKSLNIHKLREHLSKFDANSMSNQYSNHQGISRLCNVKEVAPSKRLKSKTLIYLFYIFVRWFHNNLYIYKNKDSVSRINKLYQQMKRMCVGN